MKRIKLLYFFFLLLFVANLNAQDTTYSDLGEISQFNVFTINNLDVSSSDIQGRVAVGGNAYFSNYSIGDQIPNSEGSVDILIVSDSLWYNSGRVYSGNVVYGEYADVSDNLILDGEGTVYQGTPLMFSELSLLVSDISLQWKGLLSNGSTSNDNGAIVLTGSSQELNIFSVNGDDLSSANGLTISAPEGSTVLVNISGEEINWSGDNDLINVNQTHVIYNFYEADTLTLSEIAIKGSILAPFASVNFISGQINGNLVVYSLTGEGQVNYSWFQGTIEYSSSDVVSTCFVTMENILKGRTLRLSEPFLGHWRYWAGTLLGVVNNHSTSYYCIDISHYLQWNQPYAYDGAITGPIAYILKNYYPFVPFTGDNGQLSNESKEAAAVQAAIWHFSDGFDPSKISNSNQIKQRALEIIDNAIDQNPIPLQTFYLQPASQVVSVGQSAMLKLVAKDAYGNPMPNVEVEITTTAGTVVPDEGVTDANGELVIALQYDDNTNPESAEITVTTMEAALPPGSRYILDDAQTLVTNNELITCLSTTATVYWSNSALPGNDYDFYLYSTANSQIPDNYITAVTGNDNYIYFGTANNGAFKFDKSNEEFTQLNVENNNISAIISFYIGSETYLAIGFQNDGFAIGTENDFTYYNSTNSDFNGSHVFAFDILSNSEGDFLVIAHNNGVSLFDLSNATFVNYTSQNSDLPPGVCYDVAVDDDLGIWIGTDYGLAHKTFDNNWEVFTSNNSGINGNYIRAVEFGNGTVMVGTFYSGLCGFDLSSQVWNNYSPFISTQPVMNLFYADGKFFIANWSEGIYVYDGENFKQYPSVSHTNAPSIVEDFCYDGADFWFATQSGLSRTTNGSLPSSGDASIVISENSTFTGGATTISCNLEANGEIEFYRLSGTILYNYSELSFVDYALGEAFSGCLVHIDETSPGRIEFTAITDEPITESGKMFDLMFDVSEDLASLGEGVSAVYCTNFSSGFGFELTHEDLGLINWSSSGSGNAGVGDASLDATIDMTDYLDVIHHFVYGGEFTLEGEAFENGDIDSSDVINSCDASMLLSFMHNGCFPFEFGGNQPVGSFQPGNVSYDTTNNSATVQLLADDVESLNGITIIFEFDSNDVNYNTFSSVQIGSGDYVHATELTPNSATFVFNSPTQLNGTFDLGNISFKLNNTKDIVQVQTQYSLDGINFTEGPVITLNPSGIIDTEVPDNFMLYQNYPNPFNPTTTIKYAIPTNTKVSLKIYDVLGREITTLVNTEKSAGTYSVVWDGKNELGKKVASGIYFYRLEAGKFVKVKKMILLK